MKKKVILMILNQRFLSDGRVEKEYKALENNGYRVVVLANSEGRDSEEFKIIRLRSLDKFKVYLKSKFHITDKELEKEIIDLLKEEKIENIDYIHVHDLPWSFLAFQLKKIYSSKVIIDLHENYPALRKDFAKQLNFGLKSIITKTLFNYGRLKKYETNTLKKADGYICVVHEALDRFKGTDFYNKGVVVSNTKDPSDYKYVPLPTIESKFIITYVGTIQKLRGLETAIKGMALLPNQYELNIVGVKPSDPYTKTLYSIKENHNVQNVNLINWLDDENKVNEYVLASHVCIVPHINSELTQTTIPHKLFIAMAYGRPVLVSSVKPLKRIVEETESGMVFEADNPQDFAEKVRIMADRDKLVFWGENGRKSIEGKYNWINDSQNLIDFYQRLDS